MRPLYAPLGNISWTIDSGGAQEGSIAVGIRSHGCRQKTEENHFTTALNKGKRPGRRPYLLQAIPACGKEIPSTFRSIPQEEGFLFSLPLARGFMPVPCRCHRKTALPFHLPMICIAS